MGTLSADTALIEKRIDQLIQALIKNFGERTYSSIDYDVTTGAKYYKIHHIDSGGGRSVHAFVSRQTGAVYKPASWRAPAKHARYNLLDDVSFQDCLARADWAGSYLYMR
jgi:hypothetical protein